MSVAAVIAALKAKDPALAQLPDEAIETIVRQQDPRFNQVFDRERSNERQLPAPPATPGLTPSAAYEQQLPFGQRVAEAAYEASPIAAGKRLFDIDQWTATQMGKRVPTGGQAVEAGIESLPAVMGNVGEYAGAVAGAPLFGVGAVPASVVGSGAGGGLGEAIRQGIQVSRGKEEGFSPKKVALATAEQAAYPAVIGGAKAAGQALYETALNPIVAHLNDFDLAQLAKAGLEKGVIATRKGAKKASDLLTAAGLKERGLEAAATAAGVTDATSKEIVERGLAEPWAKALREYTPSEHLTALKNVEEEALRRKDPWTMSELGQAIREQGVRTAEAKAKAKELGVAISPMEEAQSSLNKGARAILGERVPGINEAKKETQPLIGLAKVLKTKKVAPPLGGLGDIIAASSGTALGMLAGGPFGAGAGFVMGPLALRAARSPSGSSSLASALYKGIEPATKFLRYRSLLSLLGMGGEDETNPPPNPQ